MKQKKIEISYDFNRIHYEFEIVQIEGDEAHLYYYGELVKSMEDKERKAATRFFSGLLKTINFAFEDAISFELFEE